MLFIDKIKGELELMGNRKEIYFSKLELGDFFYLFK
jgi:hypothetical protein